MKNIYSISAFLLLVLISFSCKTEEAQNEQQVENAEKLYKSEKIGFFTEKMNLTENEAIHFWPIYNNYENKRDSIWQGRKQFFHQYRQDNNSFNDSALDQFLLFDQQLYQLKAEAVKKLRPYLSDDKILQMFYTEMQFKHVIINRIRGRHNMMERPTRRQTGGRNQANGPQPPSQTRCPNEF